ncbi:chromate transporter [Sinomicrobium weinanense]|uniref:Chromate transporter n=1 Tax=Sinomicrobium weinanense TaxID=2842200 RepID=A0A926JU61_9FLAO|nr:chromate transporter [Sinomicrobium weinanense]MBC9797610.1 chromate transporter [Sinomicrobium weinanense]MBU3123432.1 chromate transporter [Sinomicrobium weinanense]
MYRRINTAKRQKVSRELYVELFTSFLKIGFFMFGGGYAMIPLLERELIDKKKWITNDDLLDIISFSQMTPGTIAINAATHIGNTQGKAWGGIVASLGVVTPSLLIITLLYYLVGDHFESEIVQKAFTGIRACLVAMICRSVYKLIRSGMKGSVSIIFFLLALLSLFCGVHPVLIIVAGAALGFLIWKMSLFKL